MSRSFKKHPVGHYIKKDTTYKKIFNRKLRRTNLLDTLSPHNKSGYKKLNESYNIDDYSGYVSWKEWRDNAMCRYNCDKQSLEECRKCYERFALRK